jgi:GNAT superfamily N-acetyltransferase
MSWSYTENEVRRWYAGKLEEWDRGQVACAEDTIVAYLAASGAHIDQLFVDPDHQGAGLGSALLTAMLERRLRPATLQVFAEQACPCVLRAVRVSRG